MERESFVFHKQYIKDIPDELKKEWCAIICDYGLDGIEPTFDDWRDTRMWNQIKERIDTDCSNWEKRTAGLKRANEKRKTEAESKKKSRTEPYGDRTEEKENGAGRVSESVSESESVSVSEYESVYVSVGDNADLTDSEADFLTEKTDSEADSFTSDDLTHFDLIKPSNCYCCNSQMAKAFLTKDTKHIYSKCFRCGVYYYADKKEDKWKVGSERK